MKTKSFIFAAALAGLFFASCSPEKEVGIKEEIVSVNETVNAGSLFTYRLGAFSSEGVLVITKQAGHFETSEVKPATGGMEYLYRAPENFTGKEYAEVTLSTSAGGASVNQKTVFKFSLNVVSGK